MKILITGGAGFVGSHVAEYYANKGEEVIVFDNLSRAELLGYETLNATYNWNYLKKYENIELVRGDIRDAKKIKDAAKDADVIIHTAAQTAVTTSLIDPRTDFEVNALGTFNVLEAARLSKNNPCVVYCSTIKGDIRSVSINDKFDTCIAMFAVMGYITENSDIIKALNNIRRHLKPNGVFVFDVWNGLAVMRLLPEQRMKEMENDKIKIVRVAIPNLRAFEHICEVNYKLLILNKENNTFDFDEINEKHVVRFYFPQEIKYYLEAAGFAVLKICLTKHSDTPRLPEIK